MSITHNIAQITRVPCVVQQTLPARSTDPESKRATYNVSGPRPIGFSPEDILDVEAPAPESEVWLPANQSTNDLADQLGVIYIENRLEVIGADMVQVPGCEPTSALTSYTLLMYRTCGAAMVHLHDALQAIPGSRVEFQLNNGQSNGSRKKWFVLPRVNQTCPNDPHPDFYAILRKLSWEDRDQDDDDLGKRCGSIDQGFPSKDWEKRLPPPVQPYVKEGVLSPWDLGSAIGPYWYNQMADPEFSVDDIPIVG